MKTSARRPAYTGSVRETPGFNAVQRRLRAKRFQWFLRLMHPEGKRILDVGGNLVTWREQAAARPAHVHIINPLAILGDHPPHITSEVGDGCSLPFADGAWDIVFCNSVIEHVGDESRQRALASEIRRVGRQVWVQTPAYGFPLEPHYMAPFVHWIPAAIRRRVVRYTTVWGLLTRPTQEQIDARIEEIRLLRRSEMRMLFPDCELLVERFAGLAKTYTAWRV